MSPGDVSFVVRTVISVLALIIVAVVGTMLVGLFKAETDHAQIVAILGPAFQTIVGVFVGVGAVAVAQLQGRRSDPPPPAPADPRD